MRAVWSDGPRAESREARAPPAGAKAHGQTNVREEEASAGRGT